MACVCLHELSKYREYTIPRWLWVIYCIDSSTYAIIYTNLAMAHVFEQPRKLPVSLIKSNTYSSKHCNFLCLHAAQNNWRIAHPSRVTITLKHNENLVVLNEFTLFSLGVIFNFTGGVAGVIRARDAPLEDYEKQRSESKIGLLLLGNFIVLFCEVAYTIFLEVHKMREANAATANRRNV